MTIQISNRLNNKDYYGYFVQYFLFRMGFAKAKTLRRINLPFLMALSHLYQPIQQF